MPWCTACDRFLSPSSVLTDGSCPACGRPVDAGGARLATEVDETAELDDQEPDALPWHLWLMLAALAVYLGYRAFQGIEWIFGF